MKYRVAWYAGTVLCFFLYFSGIVPLYGYLRKKYLKQYIAVVLMYHRVSDDANNSDITVSTRNFESQMAYLKKNFSIATIDDIVAIRMKNIKVLEDTVAITFDDGYKDNYTEAYPILRKLDVSATIFVATDYLGPDSRLSNDEIKTMHIDNITFGAHTRTHEVLSQIGGQEASLEIIGSKSDLEDILEEEVKYFAYPYGKRGRDFSDETVAIVKDAGFLAAFATDNGFITEESKLFALNRIGMRNFPLFVLKARLSGIFENKLQYLIRRIIRI